MNQLRHTTLLLALSILIGCGQSETEHADHHMEHFVPEHKPPNFSEAVEAITQRTQHLHHHIGDTGKVVEIEITELADIIGWIPELAADSELNESDWTIAQNTSKAMLAAYKTSGTADQLETLLSSLQPLTESLEPLVEKAGKPEPAIHHGHDHDHGEDEDEDQLEQEQGND